MLGEALLGQKKFVEAEPLLLQGYTGLKEGEARIPPAVKVRLTEARERVVQLFEGSSKRSARKTKRLDGAARKAPRKHRR
jgi:hypothetical protein